MWCVMWCVMWCDVMCHVMCRVKCDVVCHVLCRVICHVMYFHCYRQSCPHTLGGEGRFVMKSKYKTTDTLLHTKRWKFTWFSETQAAGI